MLLLSFAVFVVAGGVFKGRNEETEGSGSLVPRSLTLAWAT